MKKIIKTYSGAIFLYSVLILGVFILNERFKYLNMREEINTSVYTFGKESK